MCSDSAKDDGRAASISNIYIYTHTRAHTHTQILIVVMIIIIGENYKWNNILYNL